MNKKKSQMNFTQLIPEDLDLTMFLITNLTLEDYTNTNMVFMSLKLKRKIAVELFTTYLPTTLLLIITFVTILFDDGLFADAIAVNLTIMLVMTTIFTSKIEELPPTSDMKMIDIWLIFCLVVPFLEVVLRTAIECMNCSCHICETKDANKVKEDEKKGASSGEVTRVWVGTRNKVAPQQVTTVSVFLQSNFMIVTKTMLCRVLKKDEYKEKAVDANDVKETSLKVVEGKCSKNICHFWLTVTGELLIVCCQR